MRTHEFNDSSYLLKEMTMRAGKINDKMAQKVVTNNKEKWFQSEVIGNIDQYILKKSEKMYSLWTDDNKYVASAGLGDPDINGLSEVNLIHIDPLYRNQGILSKLLWNFKTRQGRNKLTLQQVHSDDLYNVIANGGLSRFDKYWVNSTGQTKPFDINSLDQFYSHSQPTGWRLVLENTGDFSFFPKFTNGVDWLLEDYSWQIR